MFSEPVVGEKFFGRDEELELFAKRVLALRDGYRQNIALTGQSLSGKSSIILHFLSTIKSEGFVPVYVEVIKEGFDSFADKFIATMLYNALARRGEAPTPDLETLLDLAKAEFPKTYSAIRAVYAMVSESAIDEAYTALLTLTSILKEESGLPSIVIFDEFDNLEYLGVKNPFQSFGKVIMVQKDTMYVVSSSRNEAIKKIISEKLSLLFGNFEVVKVTNFGHRKASDYISARLPGYDIPDGVRKFLIDLTDGNPFYLDKMVVECGRVANERMTSHIGEDIAEEAVLRQIYDSGGSIHQYLTSYILELLDSRLKDAYIGTLLAISEGKNKQSEISRNIKMKQAETSKLLARLTEQGIVSRNGALYRIDDRMLAFWLKNVYDRRKKILIDGVFDKTELFRKDIRSFMRSFSDEARRPSSERVRDLFSSFSNELVQIDGKQFKVPHFTKVELQCFGDGAAFISASFRGIRWIIGTYDRPVSENDIVGFVRNVKSLGIKTPSKVIVAFAGMDDNSRLLAKELKIAVWDLAALNCLFEAYGKRRAVVL
jgi:AAA+ ATPase superfamily predicted ATPase